MTAAPTDKATLAHKIRSGSWCITLAKLLDPTCSRVLAQHAEWQAA